MKERRNKRAKFEPDNFKRDFINSTSHDEEFNEFFRRGNSMLDRDFSEGPYNRNNNADQSQSYNHQQYNQHHMLQESVNQEKIRNIKKKQEMNIQSQLQDIRRMINTPTFMPSYFQSKEGQ